ncbi:MAG TPA: response regulator [Clostridia bacterium]|nr:response regulator [Clostridia bacterium]
MEYKVIYRVVVAEDEPLILKSVVKKITNMNIGFKVVGAAEDGKNALMLIDSHAPDVLITDIRMPVMDGLELLKVSSSRYPSIKKIIISGYDDFKYAQQALKYGVADYLLKPLKTNELFEAFSKIRITLDAQRNAFKEKIINLKDNHSSSPEEIAHMVELYIKENFTQDINFDLISQNFNFNSSYLSKIFTKHIGENPSKYLISLRINKARYLLVSNRELSIKDIGELVGYPNQFYFSRLFKSVVGKSPASYRDKN